MAQSKSTKSESPVAAREQLDERQGQQGQDPKAQEQEAKAQERQQREELQQGKQTGAAGKAARALTKLAEEAPAGARAGMHSQAPTRGGFMDQLSRRNGSDALEGHYVTVDLNDKDAKAEYERIFGTDDDGNLNHEGGFGVYLEPMLRDPDTGIPETARVRLRDDTHAFVVVPYAALTPASPRGRS